MTYLLENNCFKPFKPLVTVVLGSEVKSDEELYNLAEQLCMSHPSPSVTSTPLTISTSSRVKSSSHLSDFLPALKLELKEVMFGNVPGLVEHFLQQHQLDTPSVLKPHDIFINQKYEERIEDTSEPSMLKWITSLVEYCSACLKNQTPTQVHSRAWACPRQYLKGIKGRPKLDCAIVSQPFTWSNHIEHILVPLKLKKNKSQARDADIDLAKYVYEIFEAQPTRSSVVGLTLCGTFMRLWQFDRSGAIGSELLDIKETKENLFKFLNLILLFLTSNKRVLGFDSTFTESYGQNCTDTPQSLKVQINAKSNPQDLVIDRPNSPLFRASGICGRGTTCWRAHLLGDVNQEFVIKDSWQPLDRKAEGDMLCEVTEKNVPHMVRYHHHEDVEVANQRVDIESHVRAGINFNSGTAFQTTNAPLNRQQPNGFTNRVHRRLILKDVGQPISTVNSPVHLLEAFEGCIKGHQALLNAGYLHRDVSINNIMIDKQSNDPDRKSFLIDLDVAIAYPILKEEERFTRTGTKIFMSISLLRKQNPHDFVDDLESFFWVMIWVCIHYPKENRQESSAPITAWQDISLHHLADIKQLHLNEPARLTTHFTPRYKNFKPLVDCVNQFAEILRGPDVRSKQSKELYFEVLAIFQMAQGKKLIEGS
jgi:hypothetical protein